VNPGYPEHPDEDEAETGEVQNVYFEKALRDIPIWNRVLNQKPQLDA